MAGVPTDNSSAPVVGPALIPVEQHAGKAPIRLTRPVYVVGSRSTARLQLLSSSVSKAHALIVRSNGRTYIRDLASRNKVFINGRETREADLDDGDLIKIGTFTFRYIGGPEEDQLRPDRAAMNAKLDVVGSDYPVPIEQRVVLLGRRSICDVALVEATVSTAHCVIFEMDGQRYIRDLGSRTGTYVNGVNTHQHALSVGDVIRIGETEIRYVPNEMAAATLVDEAESGHEIPSLLEPDDMQAAAEEPPELATPEIAPPLPVEEPVAIEPPVDHPLSVEDLVAAAPPIPVEEPLAVEEPPPVRETVSVQRSAVDEAPLEVEDLATTPEIEEVAPPPPVVVKPDELSVADVFKSMTPAAIETPRPTPPPLVLQDESLDFSAEPTPEELALPLDLSVEPPAEIPAVEEPTLDLTTTADAPAAEPVPGDAGAEVFLDFSAPDPEAEGIDVAPIEEPIVADEAPAPVAPEPLEVEELPVEAVEPEPVEEVEPEPVAEAEPEIVATVEPEPIAPAVVESAAAEMASPEEIIEPTEPTMQSALESTADQLALDALASAPAAAPEADELTDTSFARAVREFEGDEVGEIVEPSSAEPVSHEPAVEPEIEQPAPVAAAPLEEPPAAPQVAEVSELPAVAEIPAIADLAVPPPIDLPPLPAQQEESFAVPELKMPEVQFPPLSEGKQPEAPKAEPVAEILKVPPPPPARSPIPGAPIPPRVGPPSLPGRIPWAANQENFLGGVPLDLRRKGQPDAPKAPLSETPIGENAVKDLIDKIDHVAAAAEAASNAPPPPPQGDESSPLIASLPPRPVRPKRGTFAGSGRASAIEPLSALEPDRPAGTISTGFDGLAISPLSQMDAFSQTSPTADLGSLEDGGMKATTRKPGETAGMPPLPTGLLKGDRPPSRRPPRPQTSRPPGAPEAMPPALEPTEAPVVTAPPAPPVEPPPVDELMPTEPPDMPPSSDRRPAVEYADESADSSTVRSKYIRRVSMLVGLMVVVIAAAAFIIYNFVGVHSSVDGNMNYRNVAAMSMQNRINFQANQLRLAKDEITQQSARRLRRPDVAPGFLENREEYFAIVEAANFPESKPDTMVIHVQGTDGKADQARMEALLTALYERNQSYITDAARARRDLEDLGRKIESDNKEVARLKEERQRLQTLDESRPTAEQIKKLEADASDLEKKWNDALKALKESQAELEKVRTAPTATVAVADDDTIKAMNIQLEGLQSKQNASKSANAEKAKAARKALDANFDAFQKQIADAQTSMTGNPEAVAYVQSAQDLQEKTRQLTDDLMRRQEQQFGSLMELKERLNEQMEQRRSQLWLSDPQLQDLNDKLAILTRLYNAAVGGGLQKEAADKKAQIESTKAQIKNRQDSLPGDTLFGEAIEKLQVIIDSTRKDIADDRTKTDQLLATLQQSFTSSAAIQKLPQDQQQLAGKMQKQLEQINDARRQYNQAVDAADADADAQLRSQIVSLQTNIEARRKSLAAQKTEQNGPTDQAAVQAKQQEVATLTDAEKTARESYFAKYKDKHDAEAAIEDAKKNAETLDAIIRQEDMEARNLSTDLANVESRKRDANEAVEPIQPDPNHDIVVTSDPDRRLFYISITGGVILALFFMMILWTLHTAALEQPYSTDDDMEMPPLTGAEMENASLPNDLEQNKSDQTDDDEDHQPAII